MNRQADILELVLKLLRVKGTVNGLTIGIENGVGTLLVRSTSLPPAFVRESINQVEPCEHDIWPYQPNLPKSEEDPSNE